MKVINRKGDEENIQLDKIVKRIEKAIEYCNCNKNNEYEKINIDPMKLSLKVIQSIHDKITTTELDEITSQICMNLSLEDIDWSVLGSRIIVSNHQKKVNWSFCKAMINLYNNVDVSGNKSPLINKELCDLVLKHSNEIESIIKPERDFLLDYFGFKTLEKAYLLRLSTGEIQETPQYLFMRVALGIHGFVFEDVQSTYDMLSLKYATHATPTLFNAGSKCPGLASCFLLGMDDSVDGIYKNLSDCTKISKWAGGTGIHISNIRSKNAYIKGTGGKANGILPMLKVFNYAARHINQSGKRNGSFAIYIEPWHGDIFEFMKAMRNHGDEEMLARDLFYALWIPDYFMECVKHEKDWYLMSEDQSPGLSDTYGDHFKTLYMKYIEEGKYVKKIKARELWDEILKNQIESGLPYMLYKDSCNVKSNQKNIGTIKSSNLCAEIIEYSDKDEYAVCTLASICLPKYTNQKYSNKNVVVDISERKNNHIDLKIISAFFHSQNITYQITNRSDSDEAIVSFEGVKLKGLNEIIQYFKPTVDYIKLRSIVHQLVVNLNKTIDIMHYSTVESKRSNLKHRPLGIGVQGLADLFLKMWLPFTSKEAKQINKDIFEAIYFFALEKSNELSKEQGSYDTYHNSPISKGLFQFDLWGVRQNDSHPCKLIQWNKLRENIQRYGVRNSLLIALMPTASTSQIMGNTESIEPYTSNMFTRRTLSGEFIVINKHLFRLFKDLNLWNEEMKQRIIYERGSIQNINCHSYIKQLFKTAWEIPKRDIIDMSSERAPFVCQSQSLNMYVDTPTSNKLTKIHFYGWSKGLKTGSYYIRSKPAINSQSFTINPELEKQFIKENQEIREECLGCSA